MSLPCVLVTGVGAIIGQGIVKSLRMTGRPVRIIGLDRNTLAYGGKMCDAFYVKPLDEIDSAYPDFLIELVNSEGVDLIIPGIEQDVYYFDCHRDLFEGSGVILTLNQHDLIETARDKWLTTEALRKCGINAIPTTISDDWHECLEAVGPPPFLMKPRHGSGSRGIVLIDEKRDFDYWRTKVGSEFMVQRIVGSKDEEYTVAVFGFGDGFGCRPIVFRRSLSADGATQSAQVVQEDERIIKAVTHLNQVFLPLGPTNYQFRIEKDDVYLLEVNPRISSSTSLRAAFGYNEALMCLEYFLQGVRVEPPPIKVGRAVRFVDDYVELI